ncbi:MAG: calcium/sodium antiporter [Gammaproteobacteria bacterium]|nr:calcium/sodium antiporter [Pseudomonadales bacterium]MCP5345532.1 calcium/sodium antiporter [Pseudomonadales bacterium]
MVLDAVIVVLGFVGLIWGADKFVFGASALARNLGVSPLMIGLTIVAFGTSAPEIFSSAASVAENEPELAIGNALGSNIFNIGIALGIAALISPLKPPKSLFHKEIPALLLVTVVTGLLFANLYLGFMDAIVLMSITVFFGYKLFRNRVKSSGLPEIEDDNLMHLSNVRAGIYLALGLALLVLSADAIVHACSNIAHALGVSSAIVGLTVVALGTSLPEVAASAACALKGHHELAIGNIVGSNILNLLAVLPFPGLFAPVELEPMLFQRDYLAMLLLTLLLAWFCYKTIKHDSMIGRAYGATLILSYCVWFGIMVFQM